MVTYATVNDVLEHVRKTHSNPHALNYQDSQGKWHAESTQSYIDQVKYIALALVETGLQRGEHVGIMAKPCPGWTIADLAIIMAGGITVPLFGNLSPENLMFEVGQAELKTVFVCGEVEWIKCTRYRHLFQNVISLEPLCPDDTATPLATLVTLGKKVDQERPDLWKTLQAAGQPDDPATVIYTSGSTGQPKGAVLTQRNLVEITAQDPFHWDALNDRYLSFLPLAHVFARVLNFICLQSGLSIYYLEDPKALVQACETVHPTILVLVPRLLEKLRTRLTLRIANSSYLLSKIGRWALKVAEKEGSDAWLSLQRWFADKIVYRSFRKAFGGQVRLIACGGAKLNRHLGQFFINMGFPIYEGWGMTEGCPICCNDLAGRKVGTVGRPLEGMEVNVSHEGELLVRGVAVMKEYFKDPAKTAVALDAEGWLHTGDKGVIDEDGFITIVGRVKELYKTSTGEWVAPQPIEQELAKHNLVDHALLIAEGRPYCTCILFVDHEILDALKTAYGMAHLGDQAFLESPTVREQIEQHIRQVNRHVNHSEILHNYTFVVDPVTVEGGELTPTQKIRRSVLLDKYSELIDSMYSGEARL